MIRSAHRVLALVAVLALVLTGAWGLRLQAARQASTLQAAGSIDPTILGAFRWRSIGPPRGGRSIAISGVRGRPKEGYFGADGRRAMEDDRRRRDLGARHRWPDSQLVGGCRGGLRDQSRRRLHRHGRIVHPRRHHAGRRRLQVHRRRQDVDARRLPGRPRCISKIRIHPTNPDIVFVAAFGRIRRCRATSAASSRARTAAGRGAGLCSATTRLARSILRLTGETRTWSSPRSGRPTGTNTRCRAADRAAVSSSPPTAARPGRRSPATRDCRPA